MIPEQRIWKMDTDLNNLQVIWMKQTGNEYDNTNPLCRVHTRLKWKADNYEYGLKH